MHWPRIAAFTDTPPPRDITPRSLTDDDLAAFRNAAEHRAGMATYQEILLVLKQFAVSDWVRVRRIRKDLRWVARKAAELGYEWTDLVP